MVLMLNTVFTNCRESSEKDLTGGVAVATSPWTESPENPQSHRELRSQTVCFGCGPDII